MFFFFKRNVFTSFYFFPPPPLWIEMQLSSMVIADRYRAFAQTCNKELMWSRWEKRFYYLLILISFPIGQLFLESRRAKRCEILRLVVASDEHQFMKTARARGLKQSIRVFFFSFLIFVSANYYTLLWSLVAFRYIPCFCFCLFIFYLFIFCKWIHKHKLFV